MSTKYDTIYFNQSRLYGQVRMSESGLGWKATEKPHGGSAAKVSEPFLLPADDILTAHWSRGAKGYMVKLQTRNHDVVQLDGFDGDDFTSLKNALSHALNIELEAREHSLRGWNWGSTEFERNELVFNVGSRQDFEIPYSAVTNTNVVGKSEVAVELELQAASERVTGGDELVEIRFYVPGTISSKEDKDEDVKEEEGVKKEEDASDSDEKVESAAVVFHEQLKEHADIGQVRGGELVGFSDILFATPRGRYDMDMFGDSFRLRGKSYDYKVSYSSVQRIFVLPRLDDIHNIVMLQLDPPLRQGQTRYTFLVMQFARDEEVETELNVDDEEYEKKYKGRLEKTYDEALYRVVSSLFKGLTNRKITFVGSYVSALNQAAVACSLKASEGALYVLEKAFVFVSKSPVYIPYSEVAHIRFSRVGGSVSSSRTFDMSVTLRGALGDHQFSNINREEQTRLEEYLRTKNIHIKNDILEEEKMVEAALVEEANSDVNMMGGSQDEESEDEDFDDAEMSDVAEEFDSDAASDSEEGGEGSGGDEPRRKRPKRSRK